MKSLSRSVLFWQLSPNDIVACEEGIHIFVCMESIERILENGAHQVLGMVREMLLAAHFGETTYFNPPGNLCAS